MELRSKCKVTEAKPSKAIGKEGGRYRVQHRGGDADDAVEGEISMHRDATLEGG